MTHDRDRLDDLVGVLVRLRRTSGDGLYARAVALALAGAARAVLEDAERHAGVRHFVPPEAALRAAGEIEPSRANK